MKLKTQSSFYSNFVRNFEQKPELKLAANFLYTKIQLEHVGRVKFSVMMFLDMSDNSSNISFIDLPLYPP